MLNNVIGMLTLFNNVTDVKKINVINLIKRQQALQTLETRVVEPFFIYMSKKNTPIYIYKFLSFYGCFFPLYRGVLTDDVNGMEGTPCL